MKAEDILHAHDLDILFEGRHKAYGAYDLRKHYEKRVRIALVVVFLLVALASVWGLLHKPRKQVLFHLAEGHVLGTLPPSQEKKKIEPKKPEQPKTASKPARTQAFNSRIQVVTSQAPVAAIRELKDSVDISNITHDLPGSVLGLVKVPSGPPMGGPSVPQPPTPPDLSEPVQQPEFMPEFPGGEAALRRFLEKNLEMPSSVEANEVVTVKMRFIVGYDGKLRGYETVQDGGEDCNREVLRVLKKMPEWKPGRSRGRDVSVYYVLPVSFVRQE